MSKISAKYCGCWDAVSGYGSANRNFIMALDTVGVELTTQRVSYSKNYGESFYGETYKLAQEKEGKAINYDIKIIHIPCDSYLRYLEPCKYHIGHLFWETDRMSPEWVWNCNLMDEIWVGDNFHKEAFEKSGVKRPVWVFPQPVNTEMTDRKIKRFMLKGVKDASNDHFLFYSIFQWIERKAPKILLTAYWQEFANEKNVGLLLKTYKERYLPEEKKELLDQIRLWKSELNQATYPPVYFYSEFDDVDDVFRVHQTGDCFVLSHRGEGWSRCIAEAMVMGKPVIATQLGGIHDFLTKETYFPLKWKPINVFNMDWAPWYRKDQKWAEPDMGELRRLMRFVYENQGEAFQTAKRGQEFVKRNFSYEAVGRMLKDRLIDIQKMINRERRKKIRWLPL